MSISTQPVISTEKFNELLEKTNHFLSYLDRVETQDLVVQKNFKSISTNLKDASYCLNSYRDWFSTTNRTESSEKFVVNSVKDIEDYLEYTSDLIEGHKKDQNEIAQIKKESEVDSLREALAQAPTLDQGKELEALKKTLAQKDQVHEAKVLELQEALARAQTENKAQALDYEAKLKGAQDALTRKTKDFESYKAKMRDVQENKVREFLEQRARANEALELKSSEILELKKALAKAQKESETQANEVQKAWEEVKRLKRELMMGREQVQKEPTAGMMECLQKLMEEKAQSDEDIADLQKELGRIHMENLKLNKALIQ